MKVDSVQFATIHGSTNADIYYVLADVALMSMRSTCCHPTTSRSVRISCSDIPFAQRQDSPALPRGLINEHLTENRITKPVDSSRVYRAKQAIVRRR